MRRIQKKFPIGHVMCNMVVFLNSKVILIKKKVIIFIIIFFYYFILSFSFFFFVEISHSTAEVLDLTHDHALPFRLQFDDHSWRQHLNSLKPLGLAILLNTCNMETQEHYTQFCCHVTCEAVYNENLVPVTNRRYIL